MKNLTVAMKLRLGFGIVLVDSLLGKVFNLIQGIGGFTILGSGEVALILDVPGLMKQVMSAEQPEPEHAHVLALGH